MLGLSNLNLLQRGLSYPGNLKAGFDPSHPAAKGTIFSGIAMNGNFINLLNGKSGTIVSTPTSTQTSIVGPSTVFGSTTTTSCNFTGFSAAVVNGTIAAIVFPTALVGPAFGSMIFHNGEFGLGFGPSALNANMWGNGDTSSGISVSINTPYFVFCSTPGVGGASSYDFGVVNLQTGAIKQSNVAYAGNGTGDGTYRVGNSIGGTNAFTGSIAAVMYSNKYVGASARNSWLADPWSFWRPSPTILSSALFGIQTQSTPFDGHYNSQIYKLQRSFY